MTEVEARLAAQNLTLNNLVEALEKERDALAKQVEELELGRMIRTGVMSPSQAMASGYGVFLAKFSNLNHWCRASVSPGGVWFAEGEMSELCPTHCLSMPPGPLLPSDSLPKLEQVDEMRGSELVAKMNKDLERAFANRDDKVTSQPLPSDALPRELPKWEGTAELFERAMKARGEEREKLKKLLKAKPDSEIEAAAFVGISKFGNHAERTFLMNLVIHLDERSKLDALREHVNRGHLMGEATTTFLVLDAIEEAGR